MLKYVNTDIVFQEIPDEVTLAVNISNCPCRCPGCHSQYLWQDVGEPLTMQAIDGFVKRYGRDITCICLMGGDAEHDCVNKLAEYIHQQYPLRKRHSILELIDDEYKHYIFALIHQITILSMIFLDFSKMA